MTRSSPLPRLASALACAALGLTLGLLALPDDAEAGIPTQLQPGDRPHFFQFGFGVAEAFAGNYGRINPDPNDPLYRGRGWWGWYNTFKLHQELGFHLNGTPKGPALGFFFQQEFGHSYRGYGYYDPKSGVYYDGYLPFGFVVAPRFQWDIQPVKNLGLYLAPNFSLGYHGITCGRGCGVAHFADMQFGMNVRLIVVDRFIGWLVLPEFNVLIGGHGEVVARYQFMTGVGVAFP
ncbi:hypothetical protein ACNOYE_00445 [Nannocystaceae bacterium ST9]